jgi:hypothetical protein
MSCASLLEQHALAPGLAQELSPSQQLVPSQQDGVTIMAQQEPFCEVELELNIHPLLECEELE